MNQDQILGLVRMLLTAFGSILAAKGIMRPEDLATNVGIITTAIGAVMAAGSLVWSLWRNTHASTIAAAAALPKVQTIVTTDQKTADKVPSNKVVGPTGS